MPIVELTYLDERINRVESGCWEWTGPTNGHGYGKVCVLGQKTYAHRYLYELLVGPIPDGLYLDHLCRNTICCNPEHLEPVTPAENTLRSPHVGAKTECKSGHEFTSANTYVTPRGHRACRRCKADRQRRYDRKAAK